MTTIQLDCGGSKVNFLISVALNLLFIGALVTLGFKHEQTVQSCNAIIPKYNLYWESEQKGFCTTNISIIRPVDPFGPSQNSIITDGD